MRAHRILIFSIFVWIFATAPWLLINALESGGRVGIKYSLIFGSINTIAVVSFLLFWGWLRKKFNVPSTSFSITVIYLLLAVSILIIGFLVQIKGLHLSEGIIPLITFICPLTIFIMAMPFVRFYPQLILSICISGIFYFFLGKAWEKFVLEK